MIKNYFIIVLLIKLSLSITIIQPESASIIPLNCMINCSSEYGQEIGSFNNITAFSNCNNDCNNFEDQGVFWTKEETSLARDVYVGVRWQCVEYARRYLIITKNVTFASIESAFQIFNLTTVGDLNKKEGNLTFMSFENENTNPPIIGDLIIYRQTNSSPYGHVAVVANVNLQEGSVDVAEQNWDNIKWRNPIAYSRRIKLRNCNGNYILIDSSYSTLQNLTTCGKSDDIIGWKRVITK